MNFYKGFEIVQTYVKARRNLSLNEFLMVNKEVIPVLSSPITVDNCRELADIWRKRINEEISRVKGMTNLLNLPKVVHSDWQLAYKLTMEYKLAEYELEKNALDALRSASTRVSSNVITLFETNSNKRKSYNMEEMSTSLLSQVVLQFAHDRFCGNDEVVFPPECMLFLEEYAKESLKFRLFLHAVKKLSKSPLRDEDAQHIKLCLSRIVNLLNKEYIDIYKNILGEHLLKEITSIAKEHRPVKNYLDDTTKCILEKINKLPTIYDMLLLLNNEKGPYLVNRSCQTYQVIVILEYLLNSFEIWSKPDSNTSELTSFRRFIPILELVLADTDILVKEHMQWNEELYQRKNADSNSYTFGEKIDFILKDGDNNELNTGEFKKKNVSKPIKVTQQIKNIRDNAAILIESKKLTKNDIAVNGIDYIGNTGYLYEIVNFKDVIIALPVSKLNTPHNLATLNHFGDTLNSLYYLKSKLVELSNKVKMGKAKELFNYDLIDVFDTVDDVKDDDVENEETNVFYAPKSKKIEV